jgi:hypothetical protein
MKNLSRYLKKLFYFIIGDLAVGIIVLLIGIGFAVAALGDFIMLTKVCKLPHNFVVFM